MASWPPTYLGWGRREGRSGRLGGGRAWAEATRGGRPELRKGAGLTVDHSLRREGPRGCEDAPAAAELDMVGGRLWVGDARPKEDHHGLTGERQRRSSDRTPALGSDDGNGGVPADLGGEEFSFGIRVPLKCRLPSGP
ncbi:hypothetical protein Taro_032075 [Colocasia esculenta]|uniref:Uncharacterized protein n=1 Tax=Colocasia esculenta TaxID=4460 RepID=A0A843VQG7_COLES|nr:hypothetical protein [Colocasia esculenta]